MRRQISAPSTFSLGIMKQLMSKWLNVLLLVEMADQGWFDLEFELMLLIVGVCFVVLQT